MLKVKPLDFRKYLTPLILYLFLLLVWKSPTWLSLGFSNFFFRVSAALIFSSQSMYFCESYTYGELCLIANCQFITLTYFSFGLRYLTLPLIEPFVLDSLSPQMQFFFYLRQNLHSIVLFSLELESNSFCSSILLVLGFFFLAFKSPKCSVQASCQY